MKNNIVKLLFPDVNIEDFINKITDEISKNNIVIVSTDTCKGYIKAYINGYVYDIYSSDAIWNDEKKEFNSECLLNGGACYLGIARDATEHFLEIFKEVSERLKITSKEI